MSLPSYWPLWGLGWLAMPRMTVGLLVYAFGYNELGIVISIIGAIIDIA